MMSAATFDELLVASGFAKPADDKIYKAVMERVDEKVYVAVKHSLLQADKAGKTRLTKKMADQIQEQHELF
jgi:hypothetical protein